MNRQWFFQVLKIVFAANNAKNQKQFIHFFLLHMHHHWSFLSQYRAPSSVCCHQQCIFHRQKMLQNAVNFSITQAKSFTRVKLIEANIQHCICSTGISASVVLPKIDANLLINNISSVTKIDCFLKLLVAIPCTLLCVLSPTVHLP